MTELESEPSNAQPPGAKRHLPLEAPTCPPKRLATLEKFKSADTSDGHEAGDAHSQPVNPTKSKRGSIISRILPQTFQIRTKSEQNISANLVDDSPFWGYSDENDNIYSSQTQATPEHLVSSKTPSDDDDWEKDFGTGALQQYLFSFAQANEGWQDIQMPPLTKRESVEESTVKGRSRPSEAEVSIVKVQGSFHQTKQKPKGAIACPYLKKSPERYRCCQKYSFQRVKEVKQHLRRRHMVNGLLCLRCQVPFESHNHLMLHIKQSQACKAQEPLHDLITEYQRGLLQQYPSRGKSLEQQWYDVWDIIFPGLPRPKDIYVQTDAEETIDSLWNFWHEKKRDILGEVLGPIPSSTTMGVELEVYRVFDRVMQSTLNRFTEKRSKDDPENAHSAEQTATELTYESESSYPAYSTSPEGLGLLGQPNACGDNKLITFTPPTTDPLGNFSPSTTYSSTFFSAHSTLDPSLISDPTSPNYLPNTFNQEHWPPFDSGSSYYSGLSTSEHLALTFDSGSIAHELAPYRGVDPSDLIGVGNWG
ncbi:hypothetical protein QBC43DRAFT_327178 [Cladorrhinum sp. PSN259]|nr:hypothetical protein QBC43DRAFT_327178 [Cladorrhinum sp. PSN259]